MRMGKVIGSEERDDFYLLDNSSEQIISQDRSLHVPISGLTKDCTLEYTITYNTTGLIEEFPFLWQSFTYFQKSIFSGLSVAGEIASVSHVTSDEVHSASTDDVLIWYADDVPNYKNEDYQADLETFTPHVVLADKSLSWESEVEHYFEEISDRLESSKAIDELSSKLTAGAVSDEDKLSSIYGYIQKEFTYKALLFGPRAQIPNTADKILSNKYGDCKDLALLANRLLHAAGIRSYLALVSSSTKHKNGVAVPGPVRSHDPLFARLQRRSFP